MLEKGPDVLARHCALAVYIAQQGAVSVQEAAAHFGCSIESMREQAMNLVEAGERAAPGTPRLELSVTALGADWLEFSTVDDPTSGLEAATLPTPDELALVAEGMLVLWPALTERERALVPETLNKIARLAGVDVEEQAQSHAALQGSGATQVVREAIDLGRSLRFDYLTADGRRDERHVWPVRLAIEDSKWLLNALTQQGFERSFRLDRASNFVIDSSASDATQPIPKRNRSKSASEATIRLDKSARWSSYELPAKVLEESDTLTAKFRVWNDVWMRTKLLQMSEHVICTTPDSLMTQATQFARDALRVWDALEGGENGPG